MPPRGRALTAFIPSVDDGARRRGGRSLNTGLAARLTRRLAILEADYARSECASGRIDRPSPVSAGRPARPEFRRSADFADYTATVPRRADDDRFAHQPQLRLAHRTLLTVESRQELAEEAARADDATKAAWRREAELLVRSMNAGALQRSTERGLQGAFIDAVFVRLLGYSNVLSGRMPFTLSEHLTTEIDATEADATLGWFSRPRFGRTFAVIELKDARTSLDRRQLSRPDRLTPVDQAFLYSSKFAGCEWVIVSNFLEVRLYSTRHGQTLFESFDLFDVSNADRLLEFVAVLSPQALIGTDPDHRGYLSARLVERPAVRDRDITTRFYEHYANERNRLLQHFRDQDHGAEASAVIQATQKLLDRVIFICFAEDTRTLLSPNLLRGTVETAQRSRSRSPTRVWDELLELFRDINEGRHDVAPPIPAYNGGLFAHDPLLDERLSLSDTLALELAEFGNYDYRTSITVEVLGHIFERSIADIEALRRVHSLDADAVVANEIALADTRRSRGIYYTPRWVTEYIVETTLGQIGEEVEFDPDRLANVAVLDPACGSGAFLAQAYRFLLELVEATVPGALPSEQQTLERSGVLQKSRYLSALYGVDIMPEAVEIARLSLWLASASAQERLSSLNGIQVGNTLLPPQTDGSVQFGGSGFDACIGNPPWGADLDYALDPSLDLAHGQFDSYELFVERGIRDAVKPGGLFGFIIPDRILRPEGERLRRWLFDQYQVQQVIKLGEGVFQGVFRASVIIIVKKALPAARDMVRTLVITRADRDELENSGSTHLRSLVAERGGLVSRSRVVSDSGYDIPLGATDEDLRILARMDENSLEWTGPEGIFEPFGRGVELGTDGLVIRCNACFSWQVGPRRRAQARGGGYEPKVCESCGAVLSSEADWHQRANIILDRPPASGSALDRNLPGSGWHRIFIGEDVSRYSLGEPRWIRLGVPRVNYKEDRLYAGPKLLVRQAGVGVNVAVDETDSYCLQSVYVYRVREHSEIDPYFLLACLASRATLFYFHRFTNQTEWQSFPKLVHSTLRHLPLPRLDLRTTIGRRLQDRIAKRARARMGLPAEEAHELDLELETLVMDAYRLDPDQRQRIIRTLGSVQRLRVIREMFPDAEAGVGMFGESSA